MMDINQLINKMINKDISAEDFFELLRQISKNTERTGFIPSMDTTIYRTRKYDEYTLPKSSKDLSYPPIEYTQLQRLSSKGTQLFYSSVGYETAFVESKAKPGEYIVLSEWCLNKNLVLNQIGIIDSPKFSEQDAFLRKIFSWDSDELYCYSAEIGKLLLNGDTINGLAYPSISSKHESHNIAILPNFVDAHMSMTQGYLYKILNIEDENYEVEELAYTETIDSNDNLIWISGATRKFFVS